MYCFKNIIQQNVDDEKEISNFGSNFHSQSKTFAIFEVSLNLFELKEFFGFLLVFFLNA
jgi:hypothetical protein